MVNIHLIAQTLRRLALCSMSTAKPYNRLDADLGVVANFVFDDIGDGVGTNL